MTDKVFKDQDTGSCGELVETLVHLLKVDPTDRAAAECVLQLIQENQFEATTAISCYREAVRIVYFADGNNSSES